MATNKEINDILETRSIQIVMPETEKIFENDVLEINGLPFRERLVAMRTRWLNNQLPEVGKPVSGRLGDNANPSPIIAAPTTAPMTMKIRTGR